jgi:hypothetical protein
MEQFLMVDADGEYRDDFSTQDRREALDYAEEHGLKVERIYYVEATSEIVADFTSDDVTDTTAYPPAAAGVVDR